MEINKKIIREEIVQAMADFFLKKYFYNIPRVEITFSTDDCKAYGTFQLKENDDYCPLEDELIDAYEYRPRHKSFYEGLIHANVNRNHSFQDPLNHPIPVITIAKEARTTPLTLTGILMHELTHYYLWYIGWDFHDEDMDFDRECRRMGIPTNYGYIGDLRKISEYFKAFMLDNLCLEAELLEAV